MRSEADIPGYEAASKGVEWERIARLVLVGRAKRAFRERAVQGGEITAAPSLAITAIRILSTEVVTTGDVHFAEFASCQCGLVLGESVALPVDWIGCLIHRPDPPPGTTYLPVWYTKECDILPTTSSKLLDPVKRLLE